MLDTIKAQHFKGTSSSLVNEASKLHLNVAHCEILLQYVPLYSPYYLESAGSEPPGVLLMQ